MGAWGDTWGVPRPTEASLSTVWKSSCFPRHIWNHEPEKSTGVVVLRLEGACVSGRGSQGPNSLTRHFPVPFPTDHCPQERAQNLLPPSPLRVLGGWAPASERKRGKRQVCCRLVGEPTPRQTSGDQGGASSLHRAPRGTQGTSVLEDRVSSSRPTFNVSLHHLQSLQHLPQL